jgi:hypothetical protein
MEGPNPKASLASSRYDALAAENERNMAELERLRALLDQNNISFAPSASKPKLPKSSALPLDRTRSRRSLRSSCYMPEAVEEKPLPHLPTEIQLRILAYGLKSKKPIIDPMYKIEKDNITKAERTSRHQDINIHLLAVSKSMNVEGTRLLFANNEFVFTQAAALENFAKFSQGLRSIVKNVTLRVVGRYYDDEAGKRDLTGNGQYHPNVPKLNMSICARPPGMIRDKGIQAYCWELLADFLKALVMPLNAFQARPLLLPELQMLRIDLVNFCEHLPYGGSSFASVLRWHLGQLVDELLITGAPDQDTDDGVSHEERLLQNLVKDEGLFGTACPTFVSIASGGLKPLPGLGIHLQVVRADNKMFKAAKKQQIHPEGGEPPKSMYPPGRTIWKWTTDSLKTPKKQWMEFDRASGYPAEDVADMYSDMSIYSDDDMDDDLPALLLNPF